MNDEQKLAFRWALNQEYSLLPQDMLGLLLFMSQSILYVAEHTGDIEAIQGVEVLYPNWRGKFSSLAEAIKWHTDSQDKIITNLRSQIDNKAI